MAGVPDAAAVAANVAVFAAAIGAAVAGSLGAVKVIKNKWLEIFEGEHKEPARITGGTILDNTSMLMWSEAMRDSREATEENTRELRCLREEIREARHEVALARAERHRR